MYSTLPEARMWRILRARRLGGYKFRHQHPIGRYIVDFYCAATRLAVELDGRSHKDQAEYDKISTAWLEAHGRHVIRFNNQRVTGDEGAVDRAILARCDELSSRYTYRL